MLTHVRRGFAEKKKFLILPPAGLYETAPAKAEIKEPQQTLSTAEKDLQPETVTLKSSEPLGNTRKSSAFSITAALGKVEEKTETPVAQQENKLPSQHFSETDLQLEWQKFLQDLQQSDAIVYNAVGSFRLAKKGENVIEITYPSESARVEFEKVRSSFFNHFMHKVNHFGIVVEYALDVTMKKEIMTKRKIFDKFAELNPVLRELDEVFKLDFN